MTRKLISRFVTVFALMAAFAGQAPVNANAAIEGAAYLGWELQLAPDAPPGSTAERRREIYLAAGNYYWEVSATRVNGDYYLQKRNIYLAAGTYTWIVWVTKTRTGTQYSYVSSLRTANLDPAVIDGTFSVHAYGRYALQSYLEQR
ncbi:hypothetical protein [Amycolatopsis sp. lyj-108]|uniref:hypothetical protein n=1 Tax=Amycolatopsis sp. lyj-108 TaxID=2789286 RepID=UPI00397AE360